MVMMMMMIIKQGIIIIIIIWLSKGDIKGKPDSEITAAHDQALQAKYHATKILNKQK